MKREKNEKKKASVKQSKQGTMATQGRGKIKSDVLGSYTGTSENGEFPIQDADDL